MQRLEGECEVRPALPHPSDGTAPLPSRPDGPPHRPTSPDGKTGSMT